MFLLDYLKARAARKQAQKEQQRRDAEANAKLQWLEAFNAMTTKLCPVSGDMCDPKCVHFRSGHHSAYDFDMTGEYEPVVVGPSCKLWRK